MFFLHIIQRSKPKDECLKSNPEIQEMISLLYYTVLTLIFTVYSQGKSISAYKLIL